jgi:hypothetical protein
MHVALANLAFANSNSSASVSPTDVMTQARLSSARGVVVLSVDRPFVIIGERINRTEDR